MSRAREPLADERLPRNSYGGNTRTVVKLCVATSSARGDISGSDACVRHCRSRRLDSLLGEIWWEFDFDCSSMPKRRRHASREKPRLTSPEGVVAPALETPFGDASRHV